MVAEGVGRVPTPTYFLLSPASCAGLRAQMLLRDAAAFDLAVRLRTAGAALGDVFTFLSGLYFRGKLTYARRFATSADAHAATLVITAGRGLMSPEAMISLADLRAFNEVPIALDEPRYVEPLRRDAARLAERVPASARVVLLGSVATEKYVGVLAPFFGERLLFPRDFSGRGDMSRGGLMLRAARDERELDYVPIVGAPRRGSRPPKLAALPRKAKP